jgi:hypothetical protein
LNDFGIVASGALAKNHAHNYGIGISAVMQVKVFGFVEVIPEQLFGFGILVGSIGFGLLGSQKLMHDLSNIPPRLGVTHQHHTSD